MKRNYKHILIAALFIALAASIFPALGKPGKKLVVTVYPFKAAGASEATAEALTSITTYELGKSDKIKIIREGNLKKILDKQGLSMSGACDDSECQIEIGKLLNSQKFVRGDLARIGKKFFITLEVVDIQSGETEFTSQTERICAEEELSDLLKQPLSATKCYLETNDKKKCPIGDEADSELPPPPPPPQPIKQPTGKTLGKGAVNISTNPQGAEVYIDGTMVGKAPVNLKDIAEGRHSLMVVVKGYKPLSQEIEVKAKENLKLNLDLSTSVGRLIIKTNPAEAEVYLDGQPKGKTNVTLSNLFPGSYQVSLVKSGYSKLVKKIEVQAGRDTVIDETLAELTGSIKINSTPAGAEIWLDGVNAGKKTPLTLPSVKIGEHSIKLTYTDYEDYITEFDVEDNKTVNVTGKLKGFSGKLVLAVTPEGANVYIDVKEVGVANPVYSGQLSAGKHRVRVSKKDYKSREEDVDITPNRVKQLSWTLEKGPDIKSDMVYVPAGNFMMGCNKNVDDGCLKNEKPYHKVYLDAFYIDKYEVTVDNYKACVDAGQCTTKDVTTYNYNECNYGKSGRGNHPINCVDWHQAVAYCEYAGKHLPTESEWEKAARGTDGRKYPWGNIWNNELANYYDSVRRDGYTTTSPVGSFLGGASPYGVMDMAGNLWEWTADWYDKKYYKKSPDRNPKGASSGEHRVLRGGSWGRNPDYLRSSLRYRSDPIGRNLSSGFRCAKDAE